MRLFASTLFAAAIAFVGTVPAQAHQSRTDTQSAAVPELTGAEDSLCPAVFGPWLPGTLEIVEPFEPGSEHGGAQGPRNGSPAVDCAWV